MKLKLSSRQILLDLRTMISQAKKLTTKNKPYDLLLAEIIRQLEVKDHIPAIKELSSITKLKYNVVRKQLSQIYEDIIFNRDIQENTSPTFNFNSCTYVFLLYGYMKEKVISFETKDLPVIPRVGEEITIPFFNAYIGTNRFYVESIKHDFFDQEQELLISLKPGFYSQYWQFRKSRAIEEDELSFHELYDCSEFELKKILDEKRFK